MHEALFRRRDGISVLVATSTLAQGMNLPSEVVVIAGDDRFDSDAGKAKQLQAHEILNTAGRAGRAGEAAQALVIVVPSKVINFDEENRTIHRHWLLLQAIFSRSDQCLEIEDPVAALLDEIQAGTDPDNQVANYLLNRLPVGGEDNDGAARELLGRSLGAFHARRRGDTDWIESRIAAALARRRAAVSDPTLLEWHARLAGATGVSAPLIRDLDRDMHEGGEDLDGVALAWVLWFLDWLAQAPMRLRGLVRPSSIEDVFGKGFTRDFTEEEGYRYVLERLRKLVRLWITGSTLRQLELALGTPPERLGVCRRARKFVLRLLPDLAYAFGLMAQVHRDRLAASERGAPMPLVIATLGGLVRDGFDSADKLALYRSMRPRPSRVGAHALFEVISPHIPLGGRFERFTDALRRVDDARREWERHNTSDR